MRCAFERLPSHIIELMNFCTRSLPKTESAGTSRRTTNPLRGIRYLLPLLFLSGFGPLGAVLGAPLLAVFDAGGVECSANHVIAHTGKILHAAAAHEHDGVLLQVMTYTRNICSYFDTICQTGSSNFTQGGVGLLRRLRVNANADATLFRAALQRRRLRLCPDLIAPGTNQLCKRRHGSPSIELKFTSLSTSRSSAMQCVSGVHPKARAQLRSRNTRQETRTTTSNHNISSGRSGEGYSALRGWRPIPAALHPPIRRSLFRGRRPSLSPTGQNFPDEAVSIGKATGYVKRKSNLYKWKILWIVRRLYGERPTVFEPAQLNLEFAPKQQEVVILQLAT